MKATLIALFLVATITTVSYGQTVRCEIAIYHLSYGMEGTCVQESTVNRPPTQERTGRTWNWPQGDVRIFLPTGPNSPGPWPGNFFQPSWSDPFLLDQELVSPGKTRLVVRTSGATLPIEEWRQVGPNTVSLAFRLNFASATSNDIAILESALKRFDAFQEWDRSDDRDCANDGVGRGSLFCALRAAVEAHMGRYHHSPPATDLVRAAITERWRDRYAGHILADFNNHPATTREDVRAALQLALSRGRAETAR